LVQAVGFENFMVKCYIEILA